MTEFEFKKRKKGKDKIKKTRDKYGKYTEKSIRIKKETASKGEIL